MSTWIGRPAVGFADVRRIAVLRGGGLGDLVMALPALESLAAAYPAAEIVLLGAPMHAELLAGRPGPVHRVRCLPAAHGVHEPPVQRRGSTVGAEEFFAAVATERFDLAVQLHGGGRWSNPFLLRLGARHTVGTRTPDAAPLERWLPFVYHQHETVRWLEVVGLAGAPAAALRARLALTATDRAEAAGALAGRPDPVVTVHPGASDPRRHWPAERFAEIAGTLAGAGATVLVVGSADEAELVDRVVGPARHRGAVRGLVGRLSLSGLLGVLARSAVVVANDSGPRHLAEAVGTPTVSVYWCGNMINSGPFGRATDRPHISWTVHCPACGNRLTAPEVPDCGHLTSWVTDVAVGPVLADVRDLLEGSQPMRAARPAG